jgi:hypothetical protein
MAMNENEARDLVKTFHVKASPKPKSEIPSPVKQKIQRKPAKPADKPPEPVKEELPSL